LSLIEFLSDDSKDDNPFFAESTEAIQGVIHLLDEIQDQVADQGEWEFPQGDEDES